MCECECSYVVQKEGIRLRDVATRRQKVDKLKLDIFKQLESPELSSHDSHDSLGSGAGTPRKAEADVNSVSDVRLAKKALRDFIAGVTVSLKSKVREPHSHYT
jgi:hypothetical protein